MAFGGRKIAASRVSRFVQPLLSFTTHSNLRAKNLCYSLPNLEAVTARESGVWDDSRCFRPLCPSRMRKTRASGAHPRGAVPGSFSRRSLPAHRSSSGALPRGLPAHQGELGVVAFRRARYGEESGRKRRRTATRTKGSNARALANSCKSTRIRRAPFGARRASRLI
jgi:hypothetical protein